MPTQLDLLLYIAVYFLAGVHIAPDDPLLPIAVIFWHSLAINTAQSVALYSWYFLAGTQPHSPYSLSSSHFLAFLGHKRLIAFQEGHV